MRRSPEKRAGQGRIVAGENQRGRLATSHIIAVAGMAIKKPRRRAQRTAGPPWQDIPGPSRAGSVAPWIRRHLPLGQAGRLVPGTPRPRNSAKLLGIRIPTAPELADIVVEVPASLVVEFETEFLFDSLRGPDSIRALDPRGWYAVPNNIVIRFRQGNPRDWPGREQQFDSTCVPRPTANALSPGKHPGSARTQINRTNRFAPPRYKGVEVGTAGTYVGGVFLKFPLLIT